MLLCRRNKWVVILLPLLIVSAATAAPTVSNCSRSFVASPRSDAHISSVPEVTQIAESFDSQLASIAEEFLKPPPTFTGSQAAPLGAKSLPPVPGALLMGLTGFLCVSLVKDRRFWLAALAGLLWVSQTGIQAVPQLALSLSHRSHSIQQFDAELTSTYYLENSNRLRSDIEGTRYIGLLHHLAGIPKNTMSLLQNRLSFLRSQESGQTEDDFGVHQFAIMGLSSHFIPATNCLAAKVEQIISFSPAFVFDNLARGPPKLT
jgi:hypothetical protein